MHARSRAPAWSALLAARRTKRPFVTTYHGAYGNPGPIKAAYNSVMGRGELRERWGVRRRLDRMARAFQIAILPSLVAETFGRTSIEAQAMGCPVIVSDLGALPETIDAADRDASGFTGWLVPPGDSDSLAERIAAALKLTDEERSKIGARACEGQRPIRARTDAVQDACRL